MRRKRRNRGTWFPILPNSLGGEGSFTTIDFQAMDVFTDYARNVVATPWLHDQTIDEENINNLVSLRDAVEGQNYKIERIVGKCVWNIAQDEPTGSPASAPSLAIVCSALAILPVDNDIDNQGGPNLASTEWDPLSPENMDKPWMWRRTWILGNAAAAAVAGTSLTAPANNEFMGGGVLDGPHVDCKPHRYVNKGERLWLVHSVQQANGQGDPNPADSLVARNWTDLRVYGKMVKGRQTKRFT